MAKIYEGCCDWCGLYAMVLKPHRVMDEGLSGPVYRVCGPCIEKESKRINEELADIDSDRNIPC